LRGWEPDTWRYRIRDWRFFYEIDEDEKLVILTAAHHRREAY
jgi:mRNA interferase RelE/StbE